MGEKGRIIHCEIMIAYGGNMDYERLDQILAHYMERFDELNNKDNREYYKWEIAAQFRPMMDEVLAADKTSFVAKLSSVVALTEQTIDNQFELSFHALIDYAREDCDTVRSMLKELLWTDDHDDLSARMERFIAFVDKCAILRAKYWPDSWRYKASIRLPMMITGFYDPDHYYLFKAQQVKDFADCVAFYDELGSNTTLHLDNYYRLCDMLVERIHRKDGFADTLRKMNKGRYKLSEKDMHPDPNSHLLAFDIIYCSTVYDLYDGIEYSVPNACERKEYTEKKRLAERLAEECSETLADAAGLETAKAFFTSQLLIGNKLQHKTLGCGTITDFNEQTGIVAVSFDSGKTIRLKWRDCVKNGIISFANAVPEEQYMQMVRYIKLESGIAKRASIAEQRLSFYENFLR